MTPMIDVVFLLLIFFVCTTSFQIPESILPSPLSLAGTSATESPAEPTETELERVLISVSQRNGELRLTVNDQNCPSLARLSVLLAALSKVDATLSVLLDIDGDTLLGPVIDIYDRCRLAGFRNIQFAAEVRP